MEGESQNMKGDFNICIINTQRINKYCYGQRHLHYKYKIL